VNNDKSENYVCLARKYRPQNFGAAGEFYARVQEVLSGKGVDISYAEAVAHVVKEFGLERTP
jgi:hypothetical protein